VSNSNDRVKRTIMSTDTNTRSLAVHKKELKSVVSLDEWWVVAGAAHDAAFVVQF
jgi:hypothetical protein